MHPLNGPDPLTEQELAALDASYRSFPRFSEWPRSFAYAELWDRTRAELDEVRGNAATSEEAFQRAQEMAMRAAAFDTGAIEGLYDTDQGLTRTVAAQAALWEQEVDARGANARALFEAQLRTYELVMDAATQQLPVTEAWIRRLHEELTAPQETYTVHTPVGPQEQPLPRGEYKRYPNHVQLSDGDHHAYAPVDRVSEEMGRLVDALESAEFKAAHPAIQAAYAHYALAAVHPFADGNGRVARALASTFTYRAASIPLLILADERHPYLQALRLADQGDLLPFVDFTASASRSALGMVLETLRAALAPAAAEEIDALAGLMIAQGDLTHQELDAVAAALIGTVMTEVEKQIRELQPPSGVSLRFGATSAGPNPPEGFRKVITRSEGGTVQMSSKAPAKANLQFQLFPFVSVQSDEAETVMLLVYGGVNGSLVFGLSEVHPTVGIAAQVRIEAFIRRLLGLGMANLRAAAHDALTHAGYSP